LGRIRPVASPAQFDLFELATSELPAENAGLMQAIDKINRRFPKAVSIASSGFDKSWKPKAERVSQRYTTDWYELVLVK
jgi:DNA polymerase V